MNVDRGNALSTFLENRFSREEAVSLSQLLYHSYIGEIIKYEDIDIDPVMKDDILLIAYEERLLLPIKSLPGSAWEGRILSFDSQERYHMPRIARLLVGNILNTGIWDYEDAIEESLREAGETNIGEMKQFLYGLREVSKKHELDIRLIHAVKNELSIEIDMHDTLDRLARCGIISPRTQRSLYTGSAKYEIHPCLLWDY